MKKMEGGREGKGGKVKKFERKWKEMGKRGGNWGRK